MRKLIERHPALPYHVFNRCNSQRSYPPVLMPQIWARYGKVLQKITERYGVSVHAFVLMSNHYHLLLSTPNENIDHAMQYFHREVSRWLSKFTHSKDYRFECRYRWKLIENAIQFENTYRYIARNPCEVGLCFDPFSYPYSSFYRGTASIEMLGFPVQPSLVFRDVVPNDELMRQRWLGCQI